MTNIKDDLLRDLEQLKEHKNSIDNALYAFKCRIDMLESKIESLPDEPAFDPAKEYTFQEAAQLAFENPGWVFDLLDSVTDAANQLMFDFNVDCYFINGYGNRFKLSPQELKSKWHRIK